MARHTQSLLLLDLIETIVQCFLQMQNRVTGVGLNELQFDGRFDRTVKKLRLEDLRELGVSNRSLHLTN